MVRKSTKMAGARRKISALEARLLGLRAKAVALRREERAAWRDLQKLLRGEPAYLTTVEYMKGRKDKIKRRLLPGTASLLAVAQERGGSGMFCGCRPIRIFPQPNGDTDICILVACSDGACEYWCGTLVAPPIVGIAPSARRR